MHGRLSLLLLGAVAAGLVACGATSADPGGPARGTAQAAATRLVTVGRFDAPLYVTPPPGDARRLMVVEQRGRIRVVRGGRTLATPFLDITSKVTSGGEQGLLGLAFAPDYGTSGLFYVYYTGRDQREWVVEYHRASADRADPASARTVLRMDDPESNHNGGNLQFGPDGLLYIGTGDGGGANDQHGARGNAQNLGSLLGKLLRIDPKASGSRPYTVPASNPFTGRAGARPEVYSYGLRNPWRFSFDRKTGALWIGDVGQNAWEEIDYLRPGRPAGANLGWNGYEGTHVYDVQVAATLNKASLTWPVAQYSHSIGNAVTGGYVYRGSAIPALRGFYLFADFGSGHVWAMKGPGGARRALSGADGQVTQVSSFGQDASGELYVVSLAGSVYKIVPR